MAIERVCLKIGYSCLLCFIWDINVYIVVLYIKDYKGVFMSIKMGYPLYTWVWVKIFVPQLLDG
jgi:hypothetical protein